jgi:hypothetical protein
MARSSALLDDPSWIADLHTWMNSWDIGPPLPRYVVGVNPITYPKLPVKEAEDVQFHVHPAYPVGFVWAFEKSLWEEFKAEYEKPESWKGFREHHAATEAAIAEEKRLRRHYAQVGRTQN